MSLVKKIDSAATCVSPFSLHLNSKSLATHSKCSLAFNIKCWHSDSLTQWSLPSFSVQSPRSICWYFHPRLAPGSCRGADSLGFSGGQNIISVNITAENWHHCCQSRSIICFAMLCNNWLLGKKLSRRWEWLRYLWVWITPVFFSCCNFIMELVGVILATAKVHFGIEGGQGSK